ncbi:MULTISPECIES: LytR C-terminal domain-containing protein [unclassified Modestobacter]|uniref:LytR C-terminal domain-containing protein n=1 Tax=unclassified Modestobacter TaxID=2643866 RepID=UPI0022AAFF51|nr:MULTISPECIES: LytR C-terminal domain-containing protein [unclassified Modestobacter]MCZ2825306.1 LytR C-terminal domain-containing protein [Modestobacter sp. VKM Ac-2981]MCZ2853629.1 LytR C-terminal domain-containing protein [Modestobacter sp. VKM Ac-2982]
MTLPRQSRAERRREGLLPAGEDPLLRRPAGRPSAPPPVGGRRRTDPATAGGRPAVAGPQTPAPRPVPPVSGPLTAATPAAPTPFSSSPAIPAVEPRRTPPAPARPASGPTDRRAEPTGWRVEPTGSTAAPMTTGMPTWAAEPSAPPADVTQRVSGAVPEESAWTAVPATPAAPVAPLRAPQLPGRGSSAAGRAPTPTPAVPRRADVRTPPAEPAPEQGPPSGPARRAVDVPVGGRAAARQERQAAEAARKKDGRRTAPPARPEAAPARSGPGRGDLHTDEVPRGPRRGVQGLLAVVVLTLVVLGVWTFTGPGTEETSAQTPVPTASEAAVTPVPESVPAPEAVSAEPVGAVFAPVTVLNSTSITGLAGSIGDQFAAAGWEVIGTAGSPVSDVATTTVYYSEGDTVQQQAAAQLVEQFPDVTGPVARYFEVPGVADPGLVVVATGNWRP